MKEKKFNIKIIYITLGIILFVVSCYALKIKGLAVASTDAVISQVEKVANINEKNETNKNVNIVDEKVTNTLENSINTFIEKNEKQIENTTIENANVVIDEIEEQNEKTISKNQNDYAENTTNTLTESMTNTIIESNSNTVVENIIKDESNKELEDSNNEIEEKVNDKINEIKIEEKKDAESNRKENINHSDLENNKNDEAKNNTEILKQDEKTKSNKENSKQLEEFQNNSNDNNVENIKEKIENKEQENVNLEQDNQEERKSEIKVQFFIRYDGQIARYDGVQENEYSYEDSKYTSKLIETQIINKHELNENYIIQASKSEIQNKDLNINEKIRTLENKENNYNLYIEEFPKDNVIFEKINTDKEKNSLEFSKQGNLDIGLLNSENYEIKWYVLKYENGENIRIEGILVKKEKIAELDNEDNNNITNQNTIDDSIEKDALENKEKTEVEEIGNKAESQIVKEQNVTQPLKNAKVLTQTREQEQSYQLYFTYDWKNPPEVGGENFPQTRDSIVGTKPNINTGRATITTSNGYEIESNVSQIEDYYSHDIFAFRGWKLGYSLAEINKGNYVIVQPEEIISTEEINTKYIKSGVRRVYCLAIWEKVTPPETKQINLSIKANWSALDEMKMPVELQIYVNNEPLSTYTTEISDIISLNSSNNWMTTISGNLPIKLNGEYVTYSLKKIKINNILDNLDYIVSSNTSTTNNTALTYSLTMNIDAPIIRIEAKDYLNDTNLNTTFKLKNENNNEEIILTSGNYAKRIIYENVYTISEVSTLDGYYALKEPIRVKLSRDDGIIILNADNSIAENNDQDTIIIKYMPHVELPETGGIGTNAYIITGTILIILVINVKFIYIKQIKKKGRF